jgi:hypothetical protein
MHAIERRGVPTTSTLHKQVPTARDVAGLPSWLSKGSAEQRWPATRDGGTRSGNPRGHTVLANLAGHTDNLAGEE